MGKLKKTSCRNRRIENIEKEIEFAEEAEDIFSENEVAVQTGETITASGTLATGVNWSLSDAGNLQFSGSGAIEKDNGQDNYPWDMTRVFTVTIQRGITEIGSGAFADGTKLTKVFISADSLRTVLRTVTRKGLHLLM